MDKRSYTRLLGVQGLYSLSFTDVQCSNSELLLDLLRLQKKECSEYDLSKFDEQLFNFLLDTFRENRAKIDEIILQFMNKKWSIDRMDMILVSIIRASICEILYLSEINSNIIIDEYVTLSSLFLKPDETDFVNAIISAVAKHIRQSD